jgi:HD-GYP domain-containing protein (c-di-GMP phosphodiesterase class II)
VVQEFWERVRDRNSFDAALVQRVVHQLIDEVAQDEDILLEFAALKDFDEYTYYHSVNVAIYAIAVGMRLGLDRAQLSHLGLAALFHDIGKVKLPHDLVTKPEEFNEDDWEQMRRHPALGALTLAGMRPIDLQVGTAMAGAFEHHLRMDLSGYPKLSRPRVLHPFSRIISLCDSFDAMTSNRVYQRDAVGPDEAIRRLLYKGHEWYDPLVLKAFVHVVGVFPVGTVGRLSDGTVAVVIRNDDGDLYAPEVLVVRDVEGLPVRRAICLSARARDASPERPYLTEILDPAAIGIRVSDYVGVVETPEAHWATAAATAS